MKGLAEFFYGEPQRAVPSLCLGAAGLTLFATRSPKWALTVAVGGLSAWHYWSARLLIEDQRLGPVQLRCPSRGSSSQSLVWLTFDDGPGPETLPLLKLLNRAGCRATFFFIGEQVQSFAGLAELQLLLRKGGHTVANHSFHHPNFLRLSAQQTRREMQDTQEILEDHVRGLVLPLFRPPYGYRNKTTFAQAERCGLELLGWSVNSLDFLAAPPQRILARLQEKVTAGSILLFHDGRKGRERTLEALPSVLAWLQENEFDTYQPSV